VVAVLEEQTSRANPAFLLRFDAALAKPGAKPVKNKYGLLKVFYSESGKPEM